MSARSPRLAWMAVAGAIVVLLGSAPTASGQAFSEVSLPAPTGPHAVGTRQIVIADSTRVERLAAGPDGSRLLRVRFWYPASDTTGPTVPYMDGPTAATWVERHGFPEGFQNRVRTHARADLPLAAGPDPWPVLLFSHGMSWPAAMYQSFFQAMASHGYVVAALDHTGYADAILFPDGTVAGFTAWSGAPGSEEERRARLALHMPTWVADLRFTLDSIEELAGTDDPFLGGLSTTGVGVFGHSYGGGAAARLMEADPRVVAAANLEGGAYGADSIPFAVRQPLLHVVGGYNEADLVATEFEPDDAPLYEVVVHGTFHSTYSDLIYLHAFKADDAWLARHRYDLDPARALAITNDHLRAFFDRYVKRIDGEREELLHLRSAAEVLRSASLGYPEVDLRIDY